MGRVFKPCQLAAHLMHTKFELSRREYHKLVVFLEKRALVNSARFRRCLFIYTYWESRFRVRDYWLKARVFCSGLNQYIASFIAPVGSIKDYFPSWLESGLF